MTSITDDGGNIEVVAPEDISRPPYFGTPENPQDWIQQYVGEFFVGSALLYAGYEGYGWGTYIMYTYGSILQTWSISYWILRYVTDHWLNVSFLIWWSNLTGSWISYV